MRRSARKAAQQVAGSADVNTSVVASDQLGSASNKAASKGTERVDNLFYTYCEKFSDVIGPEGIMTFCADVELEHTDVKILMLAWKMKAEKQGYFTLEEWRRGLTSLPGRADTISKLKKALRELENEVSRPICFQEFYSYSFNYCLAEKIHKSIDIDIACELIKIVLGFKFHPQAERLRDFLQQQQEYKIVNMDQWQGILRFCTEINFPSLDNYDPNLAWPILLDNFVEWMLQQP